MKIQYLLHHEIDKKHWDTCVENASNSLVYALSWYLDIVSPEWEAIVVSDNAEYTLCCPVPIKKKWQFKYIEHPLLCKQLGLFYTKPLERSVSAEVFRVLFTRYRYIPKLSFNIDNTLIWSGDYPLRVKEHAAYLLYLNAPYQNLHRKYRKGRKHCLKQTRTRDLYVVDSDDIEPLIKIFEQDTASKIPGGIYERTYPNLRQLFKHTTLMGSSELYYVHNGAGDCLGGCWFILYKDIIIYMFSGILNIARKENIPTLLVDYMIHKYQKTNYTLMFEGANHAGIDSFLKSFGGRTTYYSRIYLNRLPLLWKQLHRTKIILHRKILSEVYGQQNLPDIELP